MRFHVYGRFELEVRREHDAWVAYRVELGKRRRLSDVVIPRDLEAEQIAVYLDDLFHELAAPGRRIERVS